MDEAASGDKVESREYSDQELPACQPLSKKQRKKQRKQEKWLEVKQEKRRAEKAKKKQRLAEKRKRGEDLGPTRKGLKAKKMSDSSCKIKVVIDLSLDEYMNEKDVNSLTSQLQHGYSANRRAANPLQLYFCGLCGKTKQRLDGIGDYKGWDVLVEEKSYDQVFPLESLVYLSSESPNVLKTLQDDKVYVIGGLVDHNQHKGLCLKVAEEKGISHAQLPISEYLNMASRKVLAVNHVFNILLRYTESHDWKKAFLMEVPARKQAQLKDQTDMEEKQEDEGRKRRLEDNDVPYVDDLSPQRDEKDDGINNDRLSEKSRKAGEVMNSDSSTAKDNEVINSDSLTAKDNEVNDNSSSSKDKCQQ